MSAIDDSTATPPRPGKTRSRVIFSFAVVFVVLLGILSGLGAFTFGYGKGWSYLSSNPANCANCHVMQGHYDSWQNSSHRHVARLQRLPPAAQHR